jgi:hypothetical protein
MKSLSFRIADDLAQRVSDRARPWRTESDSERYRQIIEEWVRLQDHPGIRFVEGPAGRRAALVAGPDVWEIIDTARAYDFDAVAILEAYPWLSAERLEIATRYCDCFPDEIDALIANNRYVAEDLTEQLDLVVRERSSSEPAPRGRRSDS